MFSLYNNEADLSPEIGSPTVRMHKSQKEYSKPRKHSTSEEQLST